MSEKSNQALKNQKKVLYAIIAGIVFLTLGFGYMLVGSSHYSAPILTKKAIDLPADKMNPQDIWMNRIESQNKLLDQKIKYIEELVLESKKQEEESEKEKRQLKQEITHLRNELVAVRDTPRIPFILPEDPLIGPPPFLPSVSICAPLVEIVMEDGLSVIKNVDHAVPAGTSVKALLVSSVDADCGVYSINDPIPVKLRILDDGHLPKEIAVKLKGGIIIGSAYGNLSSERIYMRIERLTQVNSVYCHQ